jgi:hypothetical protein
MIRRGAIAWGLCAVACATGGGEGEPAATSAGAGGVEAPCTDTDCDGACVDLETDPTNCGSCGRTCVLPHAEAACVAGDCALGACDTGFADCDADAATGCELAVDCTPGDSCATSCRSEGTLDCADPCAPTCVAPAESCNGLDDDCNTTCDDGALPGCRVGVHRAYNGSSGHLFTTDAGEAAGWGTLESTNFFWLYAAANTDLRPFFRCPKPGGSFFFTTSIDCEMTGAPLLTVGFISPTEHCGAIPLYRLWHVPNNWHFYTVSAGERDSALANGWTDQGLAGWVWAAP